MLYNVEYVNECGDWENIFGEPVSREKADYIAKEFLRHDGNRQLVIIPVR